MPSELSDAMRDNCVKGPDFPSRWHERAQLPWSRMMFLRGLKAMREEVRKRDSISDAYLSR